MNVRETYNEKKDSEKKRMNGRKKKKEKKEKETNIEKRGKRKAMN